MAPCSVSATPMTHMSNSGAERRKVRTEMLRPRCEEGNRSRTKKSGRDAASGQAAPAMKGPFPKGPSSASAAGPTAKPIDKSAE